MPPKSNTRSRYARRQKKPTVVYVGFFLSGAIHQHMTHEEPRYIFFHYWGKGNAQDLATTVRKALDLQTDLLSKQAHGKH